ncbi:ATP-binding protein [Mycobacterium sp. PS03-16]|uniref:ATP-binding protein n=1 Tax=Mycobacterium sp. PS03-16 TaxID=2559611 RepID=UPI0010748E7F|nr:ATP-binding protein [Mycobacterium sp. PS03-16]TFV54565.1 ATP-binding protein [Mycobacterium sp. PS03-16]
MIESVSTEASNGERFTCLGMSADGQTAARVRAEFARWLDTNFDLDPIRSSDLLLATNEALANAAEFAYAAVAEHGTMDVEAEFDAAQGVLTVTVADHGTWREPVSPPRRARGRGIPLMEALTDGASFDHSSSGTRVQLQWTGIHRRAVSTN